MYDTSLDRPRPRRSNTPFLLSGVILLIGVALGAAGGAMLEHRSLGSPTAALGLPGAISVPGASTTNGNAASVTDLVERVMPSVVEIATTAGSGRRQSAGVGTGIIADAQGHIVTNDHVIAGAQRITVTFSDGTTATAKLIGDDPGDDLAVIEVATTGKTLVPATFGDSSQVKPGDAVFAIGNPFDLQFSVSSGIVSGVNRESPGNAPNGQSIPGMIQTDAALNPGNSGGPLFNAKGEVIGINESIENPSGQLVFVGVGFAVASNTVKKALPDLTSGRTVAHAQLGVAGATIDAVTAQLANLDRTGGVYVMSVAPNSAAARAGLRSAPTSTTGDIQPGGDVITAIDGQDVKSVEQLTSVIGSHRPGDQVRLAVLRGGQTLTVTATLQEWTTATG